MVKLLNFPNLVILVVFGNIEIVSKKMNHESTNLQPQAEWDKPIETTITKFIHVFNGPLKSSGLHTWAERSLHIGSLRRQKISLLHIGSRYFKSFDVLKVEVRHVEGKDRST